MELTVVYFMSACWSLAHARTGTVEIKSEEWWLCEKSATNRRRNPGLNAWSDDVCENEKTDQWAETGTVQVMLKGMFKFNLELWKYCVRRCMW
jgi:hypothetical protein